MTIDLLAKNRKIELAVKATKSSGRAYNDYPRSSTILESASFQDMLETALKSEMKKE